ncbi:MAG: hypothetical protein HYV09_05790 [Deltaproteobacteria bacterium]|nr:hypothetical protein [Deltaproteobacteria bacterium]
MSRLAVALFACLLGCSSNADDAPPPPPDVPAGCNPIVGDDCLTPFPSSFHLRADSSTKTGVKVSIGPNVLPVTRSGIALSPERLERLDGFSPATPFLVYFEKGVDPSQLFGWMDPSLSLTAGSPVQVIEYDTGKRVLAFAELDVNGEGDQRQALIIHPLVRLKPATRYVIALVGLKDKKGAPLVPAPFRALRDGAPLSSSLKPLAGRYAEIFSAVERAGVARASLSLAWDVTTASDQGHLVGMRDLALGMIDEGKLGYTITSAKDSAEPHMLRQVLATVQVPWFLADQSGKSAMTFDAAGRPKQNGVVDVPIVINVPRCAATAKGPVPVVVFGHGLFGTAIDTLSGGPAMEAADAMCKVFIGTDWIGLAAEDIKILPDLLSANLNNFYVLSDRLQQAHVNAQVMTRLFLRKIKDDPALALDGRPISDGKEIYYFGVSDGGIQGTTFMALQPDIVRGVLNVPGGVWSLMLYRSADLGRFGGLLALVLPDAMDRQVAVALTQTEWDHTDSITFAPHLLRDPLPGVPIKRILVQEALGDAQVPNVATRVLARTMDIPGFGLTEPVHGLTVAPPPLDSAYTQWNPHATPLPPTNNSALPKDNGAHDAVWKSPKALQQIDAFCQPDGRVTAVCSGTCDVP